MKKIDDVGAAELGQLFVQRLTDKIDAVLYRMNTLEIYASKQRQQQEQTNQVLSEALLLSLLLLRHAREGDEALLEQAEQRLHQLAKEAVSMDVFSSMPAHFWQDFLDVCGKRSDTRALKHQVKNRLGDS